MGEPLFFSLASPPRLFPFHARFQMDHSSVSPLFSLFVSPLTFSFRLFSDSGPDWYFQIRIPPPSPPFLPLPPPLASSLPQIAFPPSSPQPILDFLPRLSGSLNLPHRHRPRPQKVHRYFGVSCHVPQQSQLLKPCHQPRRHHHSRLWRRRQRYRTSP